MRLIIIRHGDPDYAIDSLTGKGFHEAELLAKRMKNLHGDYFYQSPLGRARDTARTALEGTGIEPVTLDWLMEFRGRCIRPDAECEINCWDFLPEDWMNEPRFYDINHWWEPEIFQNTNVYSEYRIVTGELDKLLAEHGYERCGAYYRVVRPNHDTIILFCHFAVGCVLLSRILNISPMVLWHGFVAAPTSVISLTTEERHEGTASFRMSCYGDTGHLFAGGEEPAFSARFCECYTDSTRHGAFD